VLHRWKDWADPRLIVLVLNNEDLNQVTWEQRVLAGDPKFEASQVLPSFSYARFAEQLGLEAVRVRTADDVESGWEQALAARRPVVVDAITDPEVPPLLPPTSPCGKPGTSPPPWPSATHTPGAWSSSRPGRWCRASCPAGGLGGIRESTGQLPRPPGGSEHSG